LSLGASESTKLDLYEPIVGSNSQLLDCGGSDDVEAALLATLLVRLSLQAKWL
jgi:hypothetical protein